LDASTLIILTSQFNPHQQIPANLLRLDAVYDKVTSGSFVVIERSTLIREGIDNPLVARVEAVTLLSPTDYGLPATKITQLTLDRPWLNSDDVSLADIRNVSVYLQSEVLPLAGEPYDADVGPITDNDPNASLIELDEVYDELPAGRLLVVSGERTDVPGTAGVMAAEVAQLEASILVTDAANTAGQGYPHTLLRLVAPLGRSYQRGTVTISGNVVKATQGETRNEILGAGNAAVAGQEFTLKQAPLTHLAAATPTGAEPALDVRVNGLLWERADSFEELGPNERGYVVSLDPDGKATIAFGDGDHGTRLPTGANNVQAKYRSGMGRAGNVPAGKINQLASRPLGVKDVVNPLAASGGADRESADEARRNAPIGVTALGRLVSVDDYRDFALGFAGVSKARAVRLSDGLVERVHLTIAGRDGDEIPEDSDLYQALLEALRRYGDPSLPLTVAPRGLGFLVASAEIRIAAGYEFKPVQAAVQTRLAAVYSFGNREFAQPIYFSDAVTSIQEVSGVEAVRILQFGLVHEKTDEGTLTPLEGIGDRLVKIADGSRPQPVLDVPDTGLVALPDGSLVIRPAEIAFVTPRVPDLITLREWSQ
jgi:predicted phage baseplate assembly protein